MDPIWSELVKSLVGTGIAGVILAVHYIKLEPRLRAIEETIARQGRIDLLRLCASSTVAPELKEEARRLAVEIDEQLAPKK